MSENFDRKIFECILEQAKKSKKNHIVLRDTKNKNCSYKKLIRSAFILGDFISTEYKDAERIGILLPNTTFLAILLVSFFCRGKLPVMLNFSTGLNNLEYAVKTSKINKIITSRQFLTVANFPWKIEDIEAFGVGILYAEDLNDKISLLNKGRGLFCSFFPDFFYSKFTKFQKPIDPAVILFTSGSENTPKAVALSHSNLIANKVQICKRIDFDSNYDTIFSSLPSFHSFGFTCGVILPLVGGISVFLYPSPVHYKTIPELIKSSSSTILFGTNTFLYNYAKSAGESDFLRLRYVFGGGEHIKAETFHLWKEKFNITLLEGYGITETSPILAVNTPDEIKQGSVGKFMPFIEHSIREIDSIKLGGELWVKGPNIMLGYLNKDGEVAHLSSSWYNTGDVVYIDDDGYLFIVDRIKRFAKIAGEMVSLSQIEESINIIFNKSFSVVVSVSSISKGEELVLLTDLDLNREDVFQSLKSKNFSSISIPKHVFKVDSIPILASGKVDYQNAKLMAINLIKQRP